MRSDLKIGMLIGVAIVIIATFIIFKLPGGSVEERLKDKMLQSGQTSDNKANIPDSADHKQENIRKTKTKHAPDDPGAEKLKRQHILDRLYSQAGKVVDDSPDKSVPIQDDTETIVPAPIIPIRTYHTVTENETLSHISQQYYGTTSKWHLIQEANKDILPNPNLLRVGMRLAIPEE